MTTVKPVEIYITLLSILSTCFTISFALFSGSWCPYQVEKIVPCRVRNGSEPYYGPNICWRNDNGSYACTKKVLYRPKYSTTYKKVMETKYKCCPGMSGPQCERECFNCSTYQKLEERVTTAERRLSRLEKSFPKHATIPVERLDRFHRDYLNNNNVFSAPSIDSNAEGSNSLAYATMSLRVQTLLDEFRDMQNRIRLLENELSRLNTQVDDLTLSNNVAYDYGGASNSINGADIGKTDDTDAPVNKDDPSKSANDNEGSLDHQSSPKSQSSTVSNRNRNHHRHAGKAEHSFRVLEENLERGDIASTLNDDYGDELYNDNSTEQYIDQLQPKWQHSP